MNRIDIGSLRETHAADAEEFPGGTGWQVVAVVDTLTALDRIEICQGADEPFELHIRYCVPYAEAKDRVMGRRQCGVAYGTTSGEAEMAVCTRLLPCDAHPGLYYDGDCERCWWGNTERDCCCPSPCVSVVCGAPS